MTSYMTFDEKFQIICESEQKQKTTRLITTNDFIYFSRFMYKSHMYEIDNVERMSIRESCDMNFRDEMFNTSDEMYEEIRQIYVVRLKRITEEQLSNSQCFVVRFHKIY